eukprot:scaffold649155_cov41-Prasinocladus_malaysianus.AAC.1
MALRRGLSALAARSRGVSCALLDCACCASPPAPAIHTACTTTQPSHSKSSALIGPRAAAPFLSQQLRGYKKQGNE